MADSLSLDPHKWLFAPFDVGCILVRDPQATRRAFGRSSEYIAVTQTERRENFAFFDHGPELSRRFRALKVWAILKIRGRDQLAAEIGRQIELRRQIDRRVVAESDLELLGSGLSISCFRFHPAAIDDDQQLDRLNRQTLEAVVDEGQFFLSPTTLEGRYSLRICIVNFRTQITDLNRLIDRVLTRGRALAT